MECVNIGVEELLKLNEENLIMMLPPGRMGGDNTILVYKQDDNFFEYCIDGNKCHEEINTIFPKRQETYENYYDLNELYYVVSDYCVLDMGMGCFIYIKKDYSKDFILNVKFLLETKLNEELTLEDVINSGAAMCGVWREAANLTVNAVEI